MSAGLPPPASRNAPCPCGSGKRYKDCHGQVARGERTTRGGELTGALMARMREALEAQRAGRFDEAVAKYGEVIRDAPQTFDAWHMRGVSHFQSHRFDEAEADILRALAINPDLPMGRANLALVHGGRYSAINEERLSRAVLPRFGRLVADPPVDPLDGVAAGTRCHVLDLGASPAAVERIVDRARRQGAEVGRVVLRDNARLATTDEAMLRAAGPDDAIVAVGCVRPLDDWTIDGHPRAGALVVDGGTLAPVEDRLRELSGQRRRRVRLAATHDAPIDLAPLPHVRLRP
jgi:hypothetical protein